MKERMTGGISFISDIKPLFTKDDRNCMIARGVDLWDWRQVRRNSDAIESALQSDRMPPGQPWSEDKKAIFTEWQEEGMPYLTAEQQAAFFTEIDENTEFEEPRGSGVMNDAIIVMSEILPLWKDYAETQNQEEAEEALEDVILKIEESLEIKNALLNIDEMLCRVFKKHFYTHNTHKIDIEAVIDSYENFGRDRLLPDESRGELGHYDGGYHRMDSTTMWFNWAGQLEMANRIVDETDTNSEIRTAMMAGLICGCSMDFVFRLDDKGSQLQQTNPRARTDPTYQRNLTTESRIRKKAFRCATNMTRGIRRVHQLYSFYQGFFD